MPVKIFFCYAHEDELLLNKLKSHLRPLQRKGLIDVWYDRDISAGTKWEKEIDAQLNEANIILLLVSPDFMDSDYCYGIEMQRALERDKRGEARVIPIILRPVYWQDVLGDLQALPTDAKPVLSSSWQYQDEAFFNVTEGIRKVAVKIMSSLPSSSQTLPIEPSKPEPTETPATVLKKLTRNPKPLINPEGFSKRKIAIFAKGDYLISLKNLLLDSKLLDKKNIIDISSTDDLDKVEPATLFLVYWPDWQVKIDEILRRKKDATALIVYAPEDSGFIPVDIMKELNNLRNVMVTNFRGRLLNDIFVSLMTTSYQ